MSAFVSKTIQGRLVGGYYLIVEGEAPPADADWDGILAHSTTGGRMPPVLVFTHGGAPNISQRQRLNASFGAHKPKVAVITPSSAARLIGTAVSWFNPAVKLFAPGEVERALDHLGVPAAERPTLRAELDEMKAAMAPRG